MGEVLWYYEEQGRQAGPVSEAAMSDLVRLGRLPAGSRVWRAGLAGWQPWEVVPELAALAAPPPLAGPPPLGAPPAAGAPARQGWGPPPGGTAPFPPNSSAADALSAAGPGALYPKAPFGARFLALVLDNLVSTVPAAVAGVGAALAFAGDSTALGGLLAAACLVLVAWALWYNFTKDGRPNGQSIGKKATGLMVVHLPTNRPCDRGQSAVRYLVLLGLNLIPYLGWLVEPIVTLSAAGGQRLGDKAAGTQVIAVAEYRPQR